MLLIYKEGYSEVGGGGERGKEMGGGGMGARRVVVGLGMRTLWYTFRCQRDQSLLSISFETGSLCLPLPTPG